MPARLQRDMFTERTANPSLAAAVQSATTVSTKLVSSNETNQSINGIKFI